MIIITERYLIRGVAAKWAAQYRDQTRRLKGGETAGSIHARLAALNGETATVADVEAIIGNSSWTTPPTCSECGAEGGPVVQLGEEPDYESSTAWVCGPCLRAASDMLLLGETRGAA